jgi:hypothetical protein
MDLYSVYLEVRAPAGTFDAVDESAGDKLMDLLEEHSGVVSTGGMYWSATISMQAANAAQAVSGGARIIESMACKVGLPEWPQVRAEAVRQDVLHEENERPGLPKLASAPEVAEILGVSPQRVHEMARGAREFPAPVYELRTGKLWIRDAIVAFQKRWDRKPGRPDKAALLRDRVATILLACGMTTMDASVRLTDNRVVLLEISQRGRNPTRPSVAKIIDAMSRAGLGIRPSDDANADDLHAYLAVGHPAVVVEVAG